MTILELRVEKDGERFVVRSPTVGVWVGAIDEGQLVDAKSQVGRFEILGRSHAAALPTGIGGRIVSIAGGRHRSHPVSWDEILFELTPEVGAIAEDAGAENDSAPGSGGLVFRSSSSGRFYSRPSPDKDPFVTVGQSIAAGDPVCMLEVMKTYSRVRYEGEPARVVAIRPADGDDLEEGDVILELE